MSKFRVIASSLRVRGGPGTNHPINGSLSKNTIIEPQDISPDEKWFFIKTPGLQGWIFKDFLVPVATDSNPVPGDTPEWLKVAESEIGVREVPGEGDNPRIVEYHQAATLKAKDDSVPWCSSFVNWCMKEAGVEGTDSAAARSWLKWGRKLDTPSNGCIVVLKRGSNPSSGHVAFYVGESDTSIRLLGGNQGDQVKVSSFPKSMLLSYRWPSNM